MKKKRKFSLYDDDIEPVDLKSLVTETNKKEQEDENIFALNEEKLEEEKEKNETIQFPGKLGDTKLEHDYIGILLNHIKSIAVYYYTYDEQQFVDPEMLNIYKKVLFTDGERFAPKEAKDKFNFAKETEELYKEKLKIQEEYYGSKLDMEKVYTDLKKVFVIRKSFLGVPVKNIQDKIADILNYELYDKMSVDDVKAAVEQITATEKFHRAVLNDDLTEFLIEGDNSLTTGLSLPFPIMTKTFKGIREGETASFSMPSNYGKSRFTMNLAAYIAIIHKKKVLVISNEMSKEKMKLCLITTILNNPDIQKIHGKKLHVSENQLIAFKFRGDDKSKCDEDGFVIRHENEGKMNFAKRLMRESTEFRNVVEVTNWYNSGLYNSIHFVNITDHTNDELKKVIMNYYYKEQTKYVFYDTLKTDIDNIGNGEELKKTATILSNLAQEYHMYIGSTLQLMETDTDPVNLTVRDMAVSRTVKEVLDTLCLFKQIRKDDLDRYEYSKHEVDTKFFNLQRYEDPDVRYYSCVVDKNRAGPKPKLLFKINLAYNRWEELGYLRLKYTEDSQMIEG